MTNNNNNTDLEEFKYLIDSRNLHESERVAEREAIIRARKERFAKRTEHETKIARLLQLKYEMEEYLEHSDVQSLEHAFPRFLRRYIDLLYSKQKLFAADIGIAAISLSHILNCHRQPNDTFLQRLVIHSEIIYKNICNYKGDLWPRVYYWDKAQAFARHSLQWRRNEAKFVSARALELDDADFAK